MHFVLSPKLVLIIALLIVTSTIHSQNNHSFKRFTQVEGQFTGGDDYGYGVTYDHEGSVYTVGKFAGEADFDPGPDTFFMSTGGGGVQSSNAFIQKLDSSGNFLWANQYGGSFGAAQDICVTNDSCIIITGRGVMSNTNNGLIFISKLSGDGNIIWYKSLGGNSFGSGNKIDIDLSGNIYVTGHSSLDTLDLDPGIGVETAVSNGSGDFWIIKLDPNGNYLWSRFYSGPGYDRGHGVRIIGNSVYVCGSFEDSVDFNPNGTPDIHYSQGNKDIFIQRLTADGNLVWTHSYGGSENDEANDICNNENDGIVVVGYFNDVVDFDFSNQDSLLYSTNMDLFVLNLDSIGNLNWIQSVQSSTNREYANAICVDSDHNYYITGGYRGTCVFGAPDGFDRAEGTSSSHPNTFISKMNAQGEYLWSKSINSINNQKEEGWGIAIDENSTLYSTGTFWNVADFDPGPDTLYNSSPANFGDVYTLLLEPCESQDTVITINGCESYTWIDGVTYTSNTSTPIWNLPSSSGCDSIIRLNLILDDLDSTITQINSTLLSNATGVNYQWLVFTQGIGLEILSGETNQELNTTNYGLSGLYAVEISIGNCKDTSHLVYVNSAYQPIIDPSQIVSIYPNPSKSKVTLSFNEIPTEVCFKDISGRIVKKIKPETKKLMIDDLVKGHYFVLISWGDWQEIRSVHIN